MSVRLLQFVAQIALWPVPARLANPLRRLLFGWKLAPGSRIGFSVIQAKAVSLGPNARVGHFNVIRNLEMFELGADTVVGHLNRISGRPDGAPDYVSATPRRSIFTMGAQSAVTHRHYFDCTHTVTIGDFVTIAGSHSQFWTHGIDIENCRQTSDPITIGHYCMTGSRVIVLKGVRMGDCCVLGAGSVMTRSLKDHMLAGGAPARAIKALPVRAGYFLRTSGEIL